MLNNAINRKIWPAANFPVIADIMPNLKDKIQMCSQGHLATNN